MEKEKIIGLTEIQVKKRIKNNQINTINLQTTKTYKQIFLLNIMTFFNLINLILFLCILFVKSYQNSLFIGIILFNTGISIFQEIKAKKIIDQLTILTKSKIQVFRNNTLITIDTNQIVLDDFIVLKLGMQVPTDCIVVDGDVELNESLITGESDMIHKTVNATLLSGSFVTAGKAMCKVIRVGNDNYSQQIINEVKNETNHSTPLQNALDKILKIVSIIIVPLAILLFIKQYYYLVIPFNQALITTVAAVLGMIPEGLILLTSIALTVSIISLSKQNVLVQELFSIETLARIDTLCLDKTGTITSGNMIVKDYISLNNEANNIMNKIVYNMENNNATATALHNYFPAIEPEIAKYIQPFSSSRKYSAYCFENEGTYFIGATEFIFKGNKEILLKSKQYAKQGYRVLVLAKNNTIDDSFKLEHILPVAFILIEDEIRNSAKETIEYFYLQDVNPIIISGDDPETVEHIANKIGFKNIQSINATTLHTEHEMFEALKKNNIFGRVTPKQKQQIVLCLQKMNKTVAMTGDGVNDVLALSKADCSIAMFSGSEACKNTAKIILLDDDFSSLPKIVNEGRRVINNITACATMYLIKNIFSVILSFSTLFFSAAYPFAPLQLTIISSFGVGIPTFFLTYENNYNPVKNNFVQEVFIKSFPTALLIAITCSLVTNIGIHFGYNANTLNTICFIYATANYTFALIRSFPLVTNYRILVFSFVVCGLISTIIILKDLIQFVILPFNLVIITIGLIIVAPILQQQLTKLILKCYNIYKIKKES